MLRIIELHGFKIGTNPDSDGRQITAQLRNGQYEAAEVRAVQAVVRSDDRVLELGAGIGVVTCAIAARVGSDRVVAYEPDPVTARRAQQNLRGNGFDVSVRQRLCRPRRFSSNTAVFHVAGAFWVSHMSDVWQADRKEPKKKITVDVEPLEDALRAHQASILVMDIEGSEIEILESTDLTGLRAIIVEVHPKRVGLERTRGAIGTICRSGFVVDTGSTSGSVLVLERTVAVA